MTWKKLIILVVALAVVVGIIAVSENIGNDSEQNAAFFPQLSKDDISAIQISDNDRSAAIKRENGDWVVTKAEETDKKNPPLTAGADSADTDTENKTAAKPYPADSAAVATALEKIASMERDELISKNPEKQELFEVDSARGVLVEIWNAEGKKAGSFRVGKSGPDWSSNYVRLIGSDDVYTVRGRIKSALFTEENRWRDKSVTDFNPEQATNLILAKKEGDSLKIEQKMDSASNPVWTITAPEEAKADQSKITSLISSISTLKTNDWAKESLTDSAMGFTEPTLGVSVGLANGTVRKLTIGAEKNDKLYVRSDAKPETVFLITKSKINNLNKELADLKAKEEETETADAN